MKWNIVLMTFSLFSLSVQAQKQLDIQGNPTIIDTVATIRVNYTGATDVVGLKVHARPAADRGVAGYFFGGKYGISSHSHLGTGTFGQSDSGFGLFGLSNSNSGVYGESTAGYGVHGISSISAGVYGLSPLNVGVRGQSTTGIGLQGLSFTGKGVRGESTRIGVLGTSITDSLTTIFIDGRIGVVGYSDDTIGMLGISIGPQGQGIVGQALGLGGKGVMGIGVDSLGAGVWATGEAFDFVAAGPGIDYHSTSSQRWKKNVITVEDALQKIMELRGVYFDWDMAHGGKHDLGMIAEEVGKVVPEIVTYENNGIDALGMDYSRLTALLVEAIKAQNKRIDELEKLVQELLE